jgi:hypothetical protein
VAAAVEVAVVVVAEVAAVVVAVVAAAALGAGRLPLRVIASD